MEIHLCLRFSLHLHSIIRKPMSSDRSLFWNWGQGTGPEDVFTIPEKDGLHEYRMKPEKYYGRAFFLKEGW